MDNHWSIFMAKKALKSFLTLISTCGTFPSHNIEGVIDAWLMPGVEKSTTLSDFIGLAYLK